MKRVQSINGKRSDRYCIVVFNNDEMSFDYVIETFQTVLGYELSQAVNCAHIIHNRGEYIVKSYPNKEHAEAALDMLYEYGFKADILDNKQK